MQERVERFLELSAVLTGFSRVQLLGTAMTDEYLRTLEAKLAPDALDALLAAFERLPKGAARDAAVAGNILGDPEIGPVAHNLILLWYCGTWPDKSGTNQVVSADAYQAGLQWTAAGAHPPGSRQQGFGSWSAPPETRVL